MKNHSLSNVELSTKQLSIAPMMEWTDRHCRYFHRLLSPHAVLYTEMVTTGAIIHGDQDRHLSYNAAEHPVVLQLGGSDPYDLATAAKIAHEKYGYDEINLNCGCPSDRVQRGKFGACLMNEPNLVADCIGAMIDAVPIPVTVKCRIGVDDSDDYNFLNEFISRIKSVGCKTFIIHARKAWLNGLSPKENREIPPLQYDVAERIKHEHPDLSIMLNGGINNIDQVSEFMHKFDGVMIGREAYHNPYFLAQIEHEIWGTPIPSRRDILMRMIPYIQQHVANGGKIHHITRHMLGLVNGLPRAKIYRQKMGGESLTRTDVAVFMAEILEICPLDPLD
jgi:tRNA-dihydrouridine synthase A